MRRLLRFPPASLFWRPVEESEAPGYSLVVEHPMDLGAVSDRLRAGVYPSPDALLADAALIWQNAQLYNGRAHEVTREALLTRAELARLWAAAGLPPDSRKRHWGGAGIERVAQGDATPVSPRQRRRYME